MSVNQVGSFSEIDIVRLVPVINRAASVNPNAEKHRGSVTLSIYHTMSPPPGKITRLGPTGGSSTAGYRHGVQEFIELDPVNCQTSTDPGYQALASSQG